MENKRLFRTVKNYDNAENFIAHVLSFLKFYSVPKWWTKEHLAKYWRENCELSKRVSKKV